FFFFFF
nr:Chain APTP, PHE-PHE-PHE-PHE-PHE-PHE [Sulfolobus acidocaldarius DSM 639]8HKZ_APTP Chain APTP, PHE-PHE-PHE-PHE-PHE-PHE [Sulfolobus acidocaldarius DSM 639]8HL1_APTP Chain APTP, PHE-PHE-PHE-PHE-PHE-PHE [Sulfolobus acidocaldarius DSM 639]8HL2_APTP Chain APTP, PHE-PHE-PHE-PHE-PHE-PHE [Sulfolobus acidocaldarius DSM 639]8HL3_APTP Chain APTP, PHE-PHE-PHE-PHE-PHE-PHE [Sulfolobus acidocaldarius DSM 639]8HL4_APTP Chain APTP, PHE-PHE-PHE-PHE-PHE-PHE [Sulfolobus acidocaldarius DSM 639]